jgi:hypothetical protein
MTKICYIILTCEKYINTRVNWQSATCFKYINNKDCYYLSCKPINYKKNIYGWYTTDDYTSCPDKYIAFFKNLDLCYDWYVFIDDDTFIFPDRIQKFVSQFNKNDYLYIGHLLTHLRDLEYMSGGAGFVISKPTYSLLKNFISNSNIISIQKKFYEQLYGDVSFGIWIKLINEKNNNKIKLLNNTKFKPDIHIDKSQLDSCITFHYVTTREQFNNYYKLMKKNMLWFFFLFFQNLFNFFIYKIISLLRRK